MLTHHLGKGTLYNPGTTAGQLAQFEFFEIILGNVFFQLEFDFVFATTHGHVNATQQHDDDR
ncbi:MAG TPA: hypothetical protein DD407_09185 [Pseudohongiella sp.]|nr:hypothetical protein [Pseudohongiella sp.]